MDSNTTLVKVKSKEYPSISCISSIQIQLLLKLNDDAIEKAGNMYGFKYNSC